MRAQFGYGGRDVGWLALILDEHGAVVAEHWSNTRRELLSWLADNAAGLPLHHIAMAVEPPERENPERFRRRLLKWYDEENRDA